MVRCANRVALWCKTKAFLQGRFHLALLLSAVLLCLLLLPCSAVLNSAYGITEETEAEVTQTQRELEESSKRYEEIAAHLEDLNQQVAVNQEKLDSMESNLAYQKEQGAAAMRFLYFMQGETPGLLEMVLASDDLSDFMQNYEYLSRVYDSQYGEITRLTSMRDEIRATQAELDVAQAELQQEEQAAAEALEEAKAAREAVQEKARKEAEEEAARAEAERQAALERQRQLEEEEAADDPASPSGGSFTTVSDGDVNWNTTKDEFVDEWGPRLDAYLAGSPLAGQGETFASAAWDYGIDPRWSAAISNTESSKGRYCFLPHNAWGWGHISWDSWEEAIYAHAAGLAHGYGYTITVSAAKKYCPPNWANWYRNTCAQMELI